MNEERIKYLQLKTAMFCEDHLTESLLVLQEIAKNLKLMTIREYARFKNIPERTVYNWVEDSENSKLVIVKICDETFIPNQ